MSLNYDTEYEMIFSPQVFDDPICNVLLGKVGIPKNAKGNMMLLFTQPATVAALKLADDEIKAMLYQNGTGLVLHGWSKEGRASFLIETLRDFANKYSDNDSALKYATFDLHKYVSDGMKGQLTPNPFEAPVSEQASLYKFDVYEMLMAMSSQEQFNKPQSPDHRYPSVPLAPNPAPNVGRVFGRRPSS